MNNIKQFTPQSEIDTELAITDYLLNRLTENERLAFEAELKQSPQLQQLVEEERKLAAKIYSSSEEITLSRQAVSDFEQTLNSHKNMKHYRAWGVAASFVVVALFSALAIFNQNQIAPKGGFETLSDPSTPILAHNNKHLYTVVFNPRLTEVERSQLLRQFQFALISGPGEGSTYIITSDKVLKLEELKALRKHEQILFFEPTVLGKLDDN